MGRTFKQLTNDRSREHEQRLDWFNALEGIVVEQDPAQAAVKVIVPAIDETEVLDDWVPVLFSWVGPPGYGAFGLPEIGSEVILFSRMNEGSLLFCLSRYNEDFMPPAEFADGQRGLKTDGDYRIISDGDLYIRGGRVIIEADASVQIVAPGGFFVNGKRIG